MITTGLTSAHLRRQLAERDATITRLTAERDALRGALEWVAQYTHELEVKRKVRNTLKEISK
jgi:hypothetical protein